MSKKTAEKVAPENYKRRFRLTDTENRSVVLWAHSEEEAAKRWSEFYPDSDDDVSVEDLSK